MTFTEAEVTLVCKKLFRQELSPKSMIDADAEACYAGDDPHDMYIGEVVEII